MKAQIPWSVKGVEPEAREAAKVAARRAGLTLGAWLNQVIRDSGVPAPRMVDVTEERRAQGFAPVGEPYARPTLVRVETDQPQEQAQGADSFTAVMRRLNAVEGKTGRIVQALEATLKDIAERLAVEARGRPSSSDKALQESLTRLSARLDTLESETAARGQALEQGLGEIARHYSDIEVRHERGRQDIAHSVERLAERIAQGNPAAAGEIDSLRHTLTSLETRIDDVSADSRKTAHAVESALNALSSRLSSAERRQRTQESTLERALTLFNDRLQEALAREDNGQSEALRALEQAVGDISQHFEAIERRREQTNRAVEDSLRAIVTRLAETDRRQADEAHAPVDAVENALRRMMNRLEDTEKHSAEVVVTLDKRVQELRERFERTETEFRASRIAIMRAIDDVSDHVGTIDSGREVPPVPSFLTTPKEKPGPAASESKPEILQQADEQENEPAEREVRALVEDARKRARTEEAEPEMEPSPEPDATGQSPSFYMPRTLGAPAAGLRDAEEEAEQRRRRRVFHLSLALAASVIVLVVVALVTWSGVDENSAASGRPSALQSFKNALGIAQTRIEGLVSERAKPEDKKPAAAAPPPAAKPKTETQENDPKAIAAQGIALAREATTPEAAAEAATQIGRAAALGDADAQFALGRLFETGRGVTQDRTSAERWYEEAAAQGHALAMYNLGALAASLGSKEGYIRAARWFEQAAIRGVKDAQFNLAKLYEQGLGVDADPIEAYAWYAAAAAQGDKEAAQAVDRLAQAMNPSERAEAGERARKKQSSGG
jgi:localization factor PodJL